MLGLFFSHSPPSMAPSRQLVRPGHRRPNSNSFSLPTFSDFTPISPTHLRPPRHPTYTMSQSGASVSQECIEAYNDLKLNKKYKYIVFKLSDDNKQIVIEEASESQDWETFRERLINATSKTKTGAVGKGPRYAVYDFQYSLASGEGERNKIAFIAWSPDDAGIMAKMIYASSKEALKRSLTGLATELQANDPDDIEYDSIIKTVTSLRWSPNYREIVSSSGFPDNSLSIWSYPTLVRNVEIPAHESRVLHSCLSPDGQMLATAAADESLKFWKVFEKKAGSSSGVGATGTSAKAEMTKQMTIR
ncbi:Cofilin like protein [Verticillium longisporum]|nr:Cofilin like protein [Verticillium longisporum]